MGGFSSKLKRSDDKQEITSKMNTESEKLYALNTSQSSLTVFDMTKSSSSQFKSIDLTSLKEFSSSQIKFNEGVSLENNFNRVDDSKLQINVPYNAKSDHKVSERVSPTKKSPTSPNVKSLIAI